MQKQLVADVCTVNVNVFLCVWLFVRAHCRPQFYTHAFGWTKLITSHTCFVNIAFVVRRINTKSILPRFILHKLVLSAAYHGWLSWLIFQQELTCDAYVTLLAIQIWKELIYFEGTWYCYAVSYNGNKMKDRNTWEEREKVMKQWM